jgi:hypothetical protein
MGGRVAAAAGQYPATRCHSQRRRRGATGRGRGSAGRDAVVRRRLGPGAEGGGRPARGVLGGGHRYGGSVHVESAGATAALARILLSPFDFFRIFSQVPGLRWHTAPPRSATFGPCVPVRPNRVVHRPLLYTGRRGKAGVEPRAPYRRFFTLIQVRSLGDPAGGSPASTHVQKYATAGATVPRRPSKLGTRPRLYPGLPYVAGGPPRAPFPRIVHAETTVSRTKL